MKLNISIPNLVYLRQILRDFNILHQRVHVTSLLLKHLIEHICVILTFFAVKVDAEPFDSVKDKGPEVFVVRNSTQKVPFYSNIDYLLVEIY